ncbi:MAG: hypothetical protein AB4038_00565 [Prochloraceae cyanobacterium]
MFKSFLTLSILLGTGATLAGVNIDSPFPVKPTPIISQTEKVAQARLTESEVRRFINKIDALADQRNGQKLRELIDPNADITVVSAIGAEPLAVKTVSIAQIFQEGFSGLKNYAASLTIDSIDINGNRATATGKTADRGTVESGQTITTNVRWNSVIEKRGNRLVLVKWQSNLVGYCITAE